MDGLVMAGGAILLCLEGEISRLVKSKADIDLFVLAGDEETAKTTCDRILRHLSQRPVGFPHHELLVVRSGSLCCHLLFRIS